MKRPFWKILILFLLLLALLAACGGGKEHWVTGLVTQLQTSGSGALTALVIRTDSGEELGILLTDKTLVFPEGNSSGTAEELMAAFRDALQPDVQVHVVYTGGKKKLAGSGEQLTAYQADYIRITGRMNRGAVTMADGTAVDLLEDSGMHIYRLPDGTELLRVHTPSGPENHYVVGVEGFDSLSETAREQVSAYYEGRGLLYDELAELEKVYATYQQMEGGFSSGLVEQTVSPSASGDHVIYFQTTVTLPVSGQNGSTVYSISLGDAFRRETGAHIDTWELFTVPEEKVKQALLDKCGMTEQPLRAGMEAVSWDGRIVFTPGGLSVTFEPGTLPGQEYSTGFSVDCDEDIIALMQSWAVPKGQEQA